MAAAVPEQPTAQRSAGESRAQERTALLSVAAAAFLVAVKLGAGLVTGSLGLIAEAAHSGTDFVAALLTLFAVRIAVRPADDEHHYGHGKAEHLAALAESTFLILVSGFLAYQAAARLASDTAHHVATTWWAFAVLIVGAIVLVAAARLAHQSIEVLMDRADADSEEAVRIALEEFGDIEVRRLRSRHAAGRDFVDLVVAISADAGLAQAHTTADAIESSIRRELPGSDVIVHVEPRAVEGDLRERANAAALSVPDVREVHNVRVMQIDGRPELSLHVKLPRDLALGEAHAVVERLEAAVREAVPELRGVHTHIEPLSDADWATRPGRDETAEAREAIEEVVSRYTGRAPSRVSFRDADRGRVALIDVLLPAEQPLPSAHRRAGAIEEAVRRRCPELADVIVHTEPATAAAPGR